MVKDEDKPLVSKIIDNIIYLENELEKVRQLPFLLTNPNNKYQQKQLPASKVYVSLNQQYNLAMKTFKSLIADDVEEDTSPLMAYLKGLMKKDD